MALMGDDLRKVARFIWISRQTRRILTQNVAISLLIKGMAALAGQLVLLNGLGLLSQRVNAMRFPSGI